MPSVSFVSPRTTGSSNPTDWSAGSNSKRLNSSCLNLYRESKVSLSSQTTFTWRKNWPVSEMNSPLSSSFRHWTSGAAKSQKNWKTAIPSRHPLNSRWKIPNPGNWTMKDASQLWTTLWHCLGTKWARKWSGWNVTSRSKTKTILVGTFPSTKEMRLWEKIWRTYPTHPCWCSQLLPASLKSFHSPKTYASKMLQSNRQQRSVAKGRYQLVPTWWPWESKWVVAENDDLLAGEFVSNWSYALYTERIKKKLTSASCSECPG